MSNYKDVAFTPAQKDALERYGESAEAYILDKWFTPQQVRIIQLWSVKHEQPENAHIFFNRLQCKYLKALYKELPFIPFEIGDNVTTIIFNKSSIEKAINNNINGRLLLDANESKGVMSYGDTFDIGLTMLANGQALPSIFSAPTYTWHNVGSKSNRGFNYMSTNIDENYQRVDFTYNNQPTVFFKVAIMSSREGIANGIDYGKPRT